MKKTTTALATGALLTATVGLAAGPATGGQPGAGTLQRTAAAAVSGFDPDLFRSPRADSMPAIYWYWGGVITEEIIGTQMREMRSKGINEFVLFPFNGDDMRPEFGTEEWFDRVGHTIEEAHRTGMRVWLFNDNNFPSGRGANLVAHGGTLGDRTFAARPEHRLKGLWRSTAVVDGGGEIPLDRSSGVSAEDGRLAVDGQVLGGGAPLRVGAGWQDYTVAGTDVRLSGTSGGILVRASQDGRSGYLVRIDPKGVLTVSRLDDGQPTLLSTGTAVPGFTFQRPRRITVEVRGDTITPYVDGRAQKAAVDDTYKTGTVAPYNTGTDRTLWGDLVVTDAAGARLWGSDFSDTSAFGDFVPTLPLKLDAVAVVARPLGSKDAAELVELTPQLNGEGRPTWQAPAGRWQVDLFGSMTLVEDSRGYTRGYLDLLSEDATDAFLDTVPEEYVRRWPWAMGTTVPGFWDDEPFLAAADPHPFKRQPWSPTLAGELAGLGATPGKAYLASYDDLGRGGQILRGQYWQAVNNRFSEAWYKRQADWMAEHRLQLISNPLWDETNPSRRMGNTGDLTKDNQWAQVPGTDMITGDYELGVQTNLARNAGSVAHQNGQERVVLETFGNSGWQVAPDYMRATIGALAVRGANQVFLHAMWTDEQRVIFAPPFGPRSTFWSEMEPMDTWIGRVMEIARGKDAARTALIQPQRAAEQHHGLGGQGAVDHEFEEAGFDLEQSQVDFDLLTDGALADDPALRQHAKVAGGRLVVGNAAYDHAVLPETPVLGLAAARTLAEFVRSGGKVVAVGDLPADEASGRDAALADVLDDVFGAGPGTRRYGAGSATRVATLHDVGEAVSEAGGAAITTSSPAPSLRVARRTAADDTAFLVNNESGEPVRTTATFPVSGTPELWDPATGATDPFPAYTAAARTTNAELVLEPYETVAVVFREPVASPTHLTSSPLEVVEVTDSPAGMTATVAADQAGSWTLTGVRGGRQVRGTATLGEAPAPIALDGNWSVRLDRAGAETLQRPLGSWTAIDPRFSGSATYTREVELSTADVDGRRMLLDLGGVRDLAVVTVNGTRLPTALWSPYVVDVTDAVRPGLNTIEVKVINTLANERNKILPSGLLGPVSLRPQALVEVRMEEVR
ncbi:hypothetical protein DDE18_18430 [Nocardioides gansuensis]|uniref:Glycoside hydrolase n=1 Tax=Nocardioides gansuensis TaxID=2138300 RepID=A0A2T8F6W2_9ACTN|nr:glycosyl hydrolase [Nocardioides gansuensis]PVG81458.1 hypothetical protein DDE18_18430 [Nocardioides gansuensis]